MNESDGAAVVRERPPHARRQPPDLATPRQLPLNRSPGRLEFARTDLVFRFEATEIDIALRVRNAGRSRSRREIGQIEAAPFGAFLPWTPLTKFEVPPLEPDAVNIVRLRVPRPALGGGEPPHVGGKMPGVVDPPEEGMGPALRLLARMQHSSVEELRKARPWPATQEQSRNLAGNLSVHLNGRSIERHCFRPAYIRSGRRNVASFFVGNGKTDAYRLALAGLPIGWKAKLWIPFPDGTGWERIASDRWYDGERVFIMLMHVTDVPGSAVGKRLDVNVEQRSSGRVATVEFEFAGS